VSGLTKSWENEFHHKQNPSLLA